MKPGADADRVYFAHMLDCIARIDEYCGGSRETFLGSNMVQDAVVRNLQTLAESSQRLSDVAKASEPSVPWRSIAGFRNVLVHGYLGIDREAVWSVIQADLPALKAALERIQALLADKPPPAETPS